MKRSSYGPVILSLVLAGTMALAAPRGRPSLLVIPARHTIVQLGMDLVRMRALELVTYQWTPDGKHMVLHVWDGAGRRWLQTDGDGLAGGEVIMNPAKVVLIAPRGENMDALMPVLDSVGPLMEIRTMALASVMNDLNEVLRFSGREWRWLASRYRLKIQDLNAERRRWGKYGPPGGRRPPPPARTTPAQAEEPLSVTPVEPPAAPEAPELPGGVESEVITPGGTSPRAVPAPEASVAVPAAAASRVVIPPPPPESGEGVAEPLPEDK
jgi:hypothetical protein